MTRLPAPTFDEHIEALAVESPSALVLDVWRRLDQELALVAGELGVSFSNRRTFETALASDRRLPPPFADRVRKLREARNGVAHREKFLAAEEAKDFAREAWALLCELALREGRVHRSPWGAPK